MNKFVKCKELKVDFKCMISECYDFQSVMISSILASNELSLWKYYDFERYIYVWNGNDKLFWFEYSFEIKMVLVSKCKLFWKEYSFEMKWFDPFEV